MRGFMQKQVIKTKQERVRRFKKDIITLCMQYGLSIAHEDGHGNFIIEDLKESNLDWFDNADINITGLDKQ